MTVLVRLGATDAEIDRQMRRLCQEWPQQDIPGLASIRRHIINHLMGGPRLARDLALERVREAYQASLRAEGSSR